MKRKKKSNNQQPIMGLPAGYEAGYLKPPIVGLPIGYKTGYSKPAISGLPMIDTEFDGPDDSSV